MIIAPSLAARAAEKHSVVDQRDRRGEVPDGLQLLQDVL
jgi:hypothetical protein